MTAFFNVECRSFRLIFEHFFLLLKAIDDEVEKNEASLDPSDNFAWEDPHSQVFQDYTVGRLNRGSKVTEL